MPRINIIPYLRGSQNICTGTSNKHLLYKWRCQDQQGLSSTCSKLLNHLQRSGYWDNYQTPKDTLGFQSPNGWVVISPNIELSPWSSTGEIWLKLSSKTTPMEINITWVKPWLRVTSTAMWSIDELQHPPPGDCIRAHCIVLSQLCVGIWRHSAMLWIFQAFSVLPWSTKDVCSFLPRPLYTYIYIYTYKMKLEGQRNSYPDGVCHRNIYQAGEASSGTRYDWDWLGRGLTSREHASS